MFVSAEYSHNSMTCYSQCLVWLCAELYSAESIKHCLKIFLWKQNYSLKIKSKKSPDTVSLNYIKLICQDCLLRKNVCLTRLFTCTFILDNIYVFLTGFLIWQEYTWKNCLLDKIVSLTILKIAYLTRLLAWQY